MLHATAMSARVPRHMGTAEGPDHTGRRRSRSTSATCGASAAPTDRPSSARTAAAHPPRRRTGPRPLWSLWTPWAFFREGNGGGKRGRRGAHRFLVEQKTTEKNFPSLPGSTKKGTNRGMAEMITFCPFPSPSCDVFGQSEDPDEFPKVIHIGDSMGEERRHKIDGNEHTKNPKPIPNHFENAVPESLLRTTTSKEACTKAQLVKPLLAIGSP